MGKGAFLGEFEQVVLLAAADDELICIHPMPLDPPVITQTLSCIEKISCSVLMNHSCV